MSEKDWKPKTLERLMVEKWERDSKRLDKLERLVERFTYVKLGKPVRQSIDEIPEKAAEEPHE